MLGKSLLAAAALSLCLCATAFADPADGPLENYDIVAADSNDYYDIILNGGEATVVELVGDCNHRQDIDLWVYDWHGNEIGKSTSNGCDESIYIDVYNTGTFRFVVENRHKPLATTYYITVY